MPSFHHLIIPATDPHRSADTFRDLLDAYEPFTAGFFRTLVLDDEVVVNFAPSPMDLQPQHYAFLVTDATFDRVLARFRAEGTAYWADPARRRPIELGSVDGVPDGRRMYFLGPDGHHLELLTARYDWDAVAAS